MFSSSPARPCSLEQLTVSERDRSLRPVHPARRTVGQSLKSVIRRSGRRSYVWVAVWSGGRFSTIHNQPRGSRDVELNHTDTPAAAEYATVYVAFELSKATEHLGVILPGSQKLSCFRIDGGDLAALSVHLAKWRAKAATAGKPVRIVSCYEAGYDGHWLHRWLTNQGVINYEIDPASIQVNRRARRPKTDRIDLEQPMSTLSPVTCAASRGCAAWCECPRRRMRTAGASRVSAIGC